MNAVIKNAVKIFCLFLAVSPAFSQAIITTVAGIGVQGYGGDYGPATSAQLNSPFGVEVDAAGNLYIADTYNHRIRKVNPNGTITTIAGSNVSGFSGDGGPATSAKLLNPSGVTLDAIGNLYIADLLNQRIRKVTPSGTITTIAGDGTANYNGDGFSALTAELNGPFSIKADAAGNIYIADTSNNRIRKISTAGIITTVAGNGLQGFGGDGSAATSAKLNAPYGVDVDRDGNIYIADSYNNRVRKVTAAGIITTVAGTGMAGYTGDDGQATSATLNNPTGIRVDISGSIFVADTYNGCIRRITPDGVITTVAGTGELGYSGDGGPATEARLNGSVGVAVNIVGNIFIADSGNHRIRKVAGIAGVANYFPQIALGGGYKTVITFGNTGSETATGSISFRDKQANPLIVKGTLSNPGSAVQTLTGSTFSISVPPGSVGFLTANAPEISDDVKTGWAQMVSTRSSLYGVVMYQLTNADVLQYAVGLLPSPLMQNATIPLDDDYTVNRFTVFAIANPTDQNLTIKAALVDQSGTVVDDTLTFELPPGQQTAKYFYQELDLPQFQFKGSIVLRAQNGGGFAALALIQNDTQFTAIPVISGKAPQISD